MRHRAASFDEIIAEAMAPFIDRISGRIADYIASRVRAGIADAGIEPTPRGRRGSRRRVARPVLTRWVADRRARRVPTFVIEMTGLETKKKIVAKYGADAAFANGKPLPPVVGGAIGAAPKAKPPTIRKKAAAA